MPGVLTELVSYRELEVKGTFWFVPLVSISTLRNFMHPGGGPRVDMFFMLEFTAVCRTATRHTRFADYTVTPCFT